MEKRGVAPEIRFDGFFEDWEQRKLKDIAVRVTRKNKDLESMLPLTISAKDGLIDQNEFFNKIVASRDVRGYYLVKNGEFAYNKSYSNGYPWGAVKRLDRYDMGVLSTLYIVFKPTNIDSDFLAKYYDTAYWYREVSKHAAEGARNHGLLNIAASDFYETELTIPRDKEEQKKIGAFFASLDETIALHQRKLDRLRCLKKAFLQLMFPQNGETEPRLRFANFVSAWEQRKLGELMEISSAVRVHKNEWTTSGVRFLRSSDVVSNFNRTKNAKAFISDKLYQALSKKSGSVQPGDILVTGGGSIGIPYLVKDLKPLYFKDADLIWLKSSNKIDGYYLYIYFMTPQLCKYISSITHIGTISHYTIEQSKETPIRLPYRSEQTKIGKLFKQLDNTIALHQTKLEKLSSLKKAYLQKMFI